MGIFNKDFIDYTMTVTKYNQMLRTIRNFEKRLSKKCKKRIKEMDREIEETMEIIKEEMKLISLEKWTK